MTSNCEYIHNPAGILKCVSIILIAFTFVAASVAHFNSEYTRNRDKVRDLIGDKSVSLWREYYLIAAALICTIVSVVNLAIHLFSREIYWNRRTGIYDFFYHAGAFALLATSGMLNIISAVKVFEINCKGSNGCQQWELKLLAGGIAMIAGLICGVTASVVLTNRKDVERDGPMYADMDEK